MALAFLWNGAQAPEWAAALRRADPRADVRLAPDLGDPGEITFAVTWSPAPGQLAGFPRLKGVSSIAFGYNYILDDPAYPKSVPLARIVEPGMIVMIGHYVLLGVLRHFRGMEKFRRQQREEVWKGARARLPGDCPVGIMGLGSIGSRVADLLAGLGFDVAGWARHPRLDTAWKAFHGPESLPAFLARSEVLVCLLPLTPETHGILNRSLFAKLPRGACLINAGRGEHVVDADLLAALDQGQLARACLDVFASEPLPPGHPFWKHPSIDVTPHVAGSYEGYIARAASQVMENYRRAMQGHPLLNRVALPA